MNLPVFERKLGNQHTPSLASVLVVEEVDLCCKSGVVVVVVVHHLVDSNGHDTLHRSFGQCLRQFRLDLIDWRQIRQIERAIVGGEADLGGIGLIHPEEGAVELANRPMSRLNIRVGDVGETTGTPRKRGQQLELIDRTRLAQEGHQLILGHIPGNVRDEDLATVDAAVSVVIVGVLHVHRMQHSGAINLFDDEAIVVRPSGERFTCHQRLRDRLLIAR